MVKAFLIKTGFLTPHHLPEQALSAGQEHDGMKDAVEKVEILGRLKAFQLPFADFIWNECPMAVEIFF